MVHQSCLLLKTLQVIVTIGVHLAKIGVQQTQELVVPIQAIGMHQLQQILLQPAGDFVKSLFFFLSITKPNTRISIK
jgi:hypothetical protein